MPAGLELPGALPPTSITTTIHVAHRTPSILLAWYWLQIVGGQILLPCMLATMLLSRNVRRDPTLVSMTISWIIYTVIFCLLYYTGWETGDEPPFNLCLAQATMVYGAPVMTCASGFGLVVQVLLGLRNLSEKLGSRGKFTPKDEKDFAVSNRWRLRTLVALPYVLFVVFSIPSLTIGLQHPELVSRHRSFFYCSLDSHMHVATSWVAAIISVAAVVFQGWIVYLFWSNWKRNIDLPTTHTTFNVRIIVRVMIFSVIAGISWLAFMISGTQLDIVPWMGSACIPIILFLVFGTQKSLLRVWAFWIPRRERPENEVARDSAAVSDEDGLYTMRSVPLMSSKATLVALPSLPPPVHLNPFMSDEEAEAHRMTSPDSTAGGRGISGETVVTLSPVTPLSSNATPVADRDVYGWEKMARAAGLGKS